MLLCTFASNGCIGRCVDVGIEFDVAGESPGYLLQDVEPGYVFGGEFVAALHVGAAGGSEKTALQLTLEVGGEKAGTVSEVDEGRAILFISIAAGQASIPVQIVDQDEVVTKLAEKLVLQKHLTKGQRAYLIYPLLKGLLEESKARSLANLKKGISPIPDSIGNRGTTAAELAAQYGFSEDTLRQAQDLHSIFIGDSKTLAARNLKGLDSAELRKEWEEKILDLDHPVGLGAALAGMAGARATRDTEKKPNSQTQLDLFNEGVGTLSSVAKNWGRMRGEARPLILRVWRAAAARIAQACWIF